MGRFDVCLFVDCRWHVIRFLRSTLEMGTLAVYVIRDQEIELEHGVWIRKRTLIPLRCVQHVDVKQGPLARKYKLASLYIYTAAMAHEIPFLDEQAAEKLRYTFLL